MMAYHGTNSQYEGKYPKLWLDEDFAQRFREAFGREMTSEEREFFGLEAFPTEPDDCSEAAD